MSLSVTSVEKIVKKSQKKVEKKVEKRKNVLEKFIPKRFF